MGISAVSSSSLLVTRAMNNVTRSYDQSVERIKANTRLTQAAVDPGGLVQVNAYQAKINLANTALGSAQKAATLTNTVSSGLSDVSDVLTKISDLVTRASGLSSSDAAGRADVQSQYTSLISTLEKVIATKTTATGGKVLDGTLAPGKGFVISDQQTGASDTVTVKTGSVSSRVLGSATLKLSDIDLSAAVGNSGSSTTTGTNTTTSTSGSGLAGAVGGVLTGVGGAVTTIGNNVTGTTTTTTTTGTGTGTSGTANFSAIRDAVKAAIATVSGYSEAVAVTGRTIATRTEGLTARLNGYQSAKGVVTNVNQAAEQANIAAQKIAMQRVQALAASQISGDNAGAQRLLGN